MSKYKWEASFGYPEEHWTAKADRVGYGRWLMGEDDDGNLLAPSKTRDGWWDRPLNLRDPRHWLYYLNSRLTRRIMFLE